MSRPRVLFLAQRTSFPGGVTPPTGSGAHVTGTLAGLREHFEVLDLLADDDEGPVRGSALGALRPWVPARLRGCRTDAHLLWADRRFAREALARATAFAPDVVYERSEYLALSGARISRSLGIPLVLEVNGPLDLDAQTMYRSLAEPLGRALEVRKHRRAARIVVESPGMVQVVTERGASPERIAIVPNSISRERIRAEPRPVRENSAIVGWVGHLMRWHVDAIEFLMAAVPDVLRAAPTAAFRIVAGGPAALDLERQARRLGLEGKIEFTGPVPASAVLDAMSGFDVGVIPAHRSYAFPVKLVEMGAVGLPVVAPRSWSLDQMLAPGLEYEPFDAGDTKSLALALARVLTDAGRRRDLGQALHAAVSERFTWSSTGEALASAIEPLLDQGLRKSFLR